VLGGGEERVLVGSDIFTSLVLKRLLRL